MQPRRAVFSSESNDDSYCADDLPCAWFERWREKSEKKLSTRQLLNYFCFHSLLRCVADSPFQLSHSDFGFPLSKFGEEEEEEGGVVVDGALLVLVDPGLTGPFLFGETDLGASKSGGVNRVRRSEDARNADIIVG